MGEDTRDIQGRIEATREQMGATVDALAAKADVPSRVKGAVADKKDALVGRVAGAKDKVVDARTSVVGVGEGAADQAKVTARRSVGVAQQNPIGLAIGSLAAGFLIGMLVPSTTIEDERLGPVSEQLKHQAREIGGEAVDHGKQLAQEVVETASNTAKESGIEHTQQLRESVMEGAGSEGPEPTDYGPTVPHPRHTT